jgi:hypothetical protein
MAALKSLPRNDLHNKTPYRHAFARKVFFITKKKTPYKKSYIPDLYGGLARPCGEK